MRSVCAVQNSEFGCACVVTYCPNQPCRPRPLTFNLLALIDVLFLKYVLVAAKRNKRTFEEWRQSMASGNSPACERVGEVPCIYVRNGQVCLSYSTCTTNVHHHDGNKTFCGSGLQEPA